jgi:molybdopterin converting factor subunit 1
VSVTVLLFASYADALGSSRFRLELPENATVGDVLADLRGRPGAALLPPEPLVAINERYARPTSALREGDEVAIIPPVAGG